MPKVFAVGPEAVQIRRDIDLAVAHTEYAVRVEWRTTGYCRACGTNLDSSMPELFCVLECTGVTCRRCAPCMARVAAGYCSAFKTFELAEVVAETKRRIAEGRVVQKPQESLPEETQNV